MLRVSGLCESACDSKMSNQLVLRLYGVKLKVDEIFTFSRSFNGFDRLAAGEVVGQDSMGEYRVDRPSRIIFPIDPAKAAMGSELYLLAEEIE